MDEIDERATRVPLTEFAKICSLRLNRFTITATGYICSIFFFFFDLVNHARFFSSSNRSTLESSDSTDVLFFFLHPSSFLSRVSPLFFYPISRIPTFTQLYTIEMPPNFYTVHGVRYTASTRARLFFLSLSFFFFPFTRHVIISRMRIPLPRE